MNSNLYINQVRAILLTLLFSHNVLAAVNELVPTGSYTQDPYKWTGMVIANGNSGPWRGSGSVIWHPKMVVSCAHVGFENGNWIAVSNTTWSRAYNGSGLPPASQRMPLAGRYSFQGYQSSAINLGVNAPATFSLDIVSFWSYENTANGGHGGSVDNGIDAITRIIPKMFTGYPGKPNGISSESYSMWRSSVFSQKYLYATGRYYISGGVGSYGGVSGGPLWVYTNANWYQAGVVVSGSSSSNGVVGFDNSTNQLFEAAAAAATPPPSATPSIKITSPIGIQIQSWGSTYHIGTLPIGSSRTENFTIRNTGNAVLTLSNLIASPPFSAAFTTGNSIPAGGSGTLRITFSPTAAGAAGGAGAVRFATNDPAHNKQNVGGGIYNEFSINISGNGSLEGASLPELTLGTSKSGSLSSAVRSTTYRFNAATAGNYRFYTTGNPDTVGELFDSENQRIAYNDENARYISGKPGPVAGGNFTIEIYLQPGIYYLKVSGYDSTVTGNYQLFAEQRAPKIEVSMLGFEINPDEIFFYEFFKLGIGKSSSLAIKVKNTGAVPLFLESVVLEGKNASEFSVIQPTNVTLAVGAQTTIQVAFSPTSIGRKEAALWINSNDPENSPVGIVLYGTGILEPGLSIEYPAGTHLTSGATLPFGNVNRGTFLDRMVTIRNPGEAILEIPSTIIRGTNLSDFTFVTAPPSTLAPGATATFTIRFTPSGSGSRTAIVDIANNVYIGADFFLNLSGTGVATPEIAIESPSGSDLVAGSAMILFGSTDLGSNSVRSFTIRNLGTATLSGIAATFSGGNSSDFSLVTTPPTSIQAGASSTFSIRFNPGAAGVRSTTLRIASNDADENPFNISLSGTGVSTPKLVFGYTASIDLPSGTTQELLLNNFKVGSTMTRSYTIKNQGTAPLSNIAVSLSGANSNDFSITTHPAATIAPGASSFFTFRFTPTAPGVRTATINIASNDPNNPFTITHFASVTGAPKIAVSESDRNLVSGSDLVDFGEVFTGKQSSRTFIIRNEGTAELSGLTAVFHSGFSTGFSLTQPAPSIPPGGSGTFTVSFSPNAGGLRTTILRIASNDSDQNPFQIQISGSGIIVPDIQIYEPDGERFISDGNPLAFETTPVNSMKSIRLKIKNGGIGTLSGIHAEIEGADAEDFSFQHLPPESPYPTNLSPGLEHEFFVQFWPKAAGSRNATLKITSNDPDENPFIIPLTGVAVIAPEISAEAFFSGDFDTIFVGQSSWELPVIVSNNGSETLAISSLRLGGEHAEDFAIIDDGFKMSIAPRNGTKLKVVFTPSSPGARVAYLEIHSNDPENPVFKVALTGVGRNGPLVQVDVVNALYSSTNVFGGAFGNVRLVQGGVHREFRISNVGNQPLTGISSSLVTNTNEFSLSSGSFPSTLQPGQSFIRKVTFRPLTLGYKTATFRVTSNSIEGTYNLQLTGTGVSEKNVIVNGDFSVPDGSPGKGWTGTFSRRTGEPVLNGGGHYFFAGAVASRIISQIYVLTAEEREYVRPASGNASRLNYYFSADVFGFRDQNDYALVVVTFLNSTGGTVGTLTLDGRDGKPSSWPATLTAGSFPNFKRIGPGAVPMGTVSIKTEIKAYRSAGSNNDGYVDNVRLEIGRSGSEAVRGFENWAKAANLTPGQSSEGLDPHGDGVSNLLKYAFNMDGTRPDVSQLIPNTGTSGLPIIEFIYSPEESQGYLTFEFLRRRKSGLVYTPMISESLDVSSFVPVTASTSITQINSEWDRVWMILIQQLNSRHTGSMVQFAHGENRRQKT